MNGNSCIETPPPVRVITAGDAAAGVTGIISSADISYAASLLWINSLGTQPRGLFLPVASAQTHPGSFSNSKITVSFL